MVASSSVSSGRIGKILEEVPSFAPAYRTLAACYGHLGRLDEAQSIIKRLASLTPVVTPTTIPVRNAGAEPSGSRRSGDTDPRALAPGAHPVARRFGLCPRHADGVVRE
jgi:hypothetical protein